MSCRPYEPREPGIISANDIRGFNLEGKEWKHLLIRSPYGIAYYGETGALAYIEIYEGVTTIGWGAFRGCSSLTSVTLPEGVHMGWSAFPSSCQVVRRK